MMPVCDDFSKKNTIFFISIDSSSLMLITSITEGEKRTSDDVYPNNKKFDPVIFIVRYRHTSWHGMHLTIMKVLCVC